MALIVCKPEDGSGNLAKRVYRTHTGGWTADRAQAREYPTREAALADHPRALLAARLKGYRTPVVVER